MRPSSVLVVGSFLGVAIASAVPVAAEGGGEGEPSAEERAALHVFDEGRDLFEEGAYEQALERFRKASEILENVYIRYYLGRTQAALDRCGEALPHLASVRGEIPEGSEDAEEARRLRARDAARCRIARAEARIEQGRCRDASELLAAMPVEARPEASREAYGELVERAERCVARFGTGEEAGREAARKHAEALAHLEGDRPEEALAAARASLEAKPTARGRYVLGLAMATLERCRRALPLLERMVGSDDAAPDPERLRGALRRCRLEKARRLVGEAKEGAREPEEACRAAMPLLEALEGALSGDDAAWRTEAASWCEPRVTPFRTDTGTRRGAHELYASAREAELAGRRKRAEELYAKALELVDEPVIRRRLAAVRIARGRCDGVVELVEGVDEARRRPADEARRRACGPWAPPEELSAERLWAYVRAIAAGLAERGAERPAAAAEALERAHAIGGNPRVAAAALDRRFEAGACEAYVEGVEAATAAVREHLSERDERLEACGAQARMASGEPGGPKGSTSGSPAPQGVSDTADEEAVGFPWGWVMGSVGVAIVGGVTAGLVLRDEGGAPAADFEHRVP